MEFAWHGQIAQVPQRIYLADASIAENIAFGISATQIDVERLREAARKADIAGFIESLPKGYQTEVGERGVRLSGGQKQRIGLARAFYKHARLLVLDEATSALDDETEAAVVGSLGAVGRDLTIVTIAHRLTSLRNCDVIYRLDHGRIVARTTYTALLAERGTSSAPAASRPRSVLPS
jgi:ABC-type multidrug transport system fused ATPase/permease subunit